MNAASDSQLAEEFKQQGNAAFQSKSYAKAIELYSKAIGTLFHTLNFIF